MKSSKSQTQFLLGIIIVAIGILALADNLSIFNFVNIFHFWPTLFIVLGFIKLSPPATAKQRLWGAGFIFAGIIMTLNSMGIIHSQLHDWWPLLLIILGIKMLFSEKHKNVFNSTEYLSNIDSSEPDINIVAVLGGSTGNVTTQDFKGGTINAMLGGVELDLRGAAIQSHASIDVTAVSGGIVLKVPREWIIDNQVSAFLGGVQDKTLPILGSQQRLTLTGFAFMGGVEIKN
jgi:predicted membrane protein